MKIGKISSLHDDLLTPKVTEHLGEYKDYPERFNPLDSSVITRLSQFGVDIDMLKQKYGEDLRKLSWDLYLDILAHAVSERYDVIVGSVFDRYVLPNPISPGFDVRTREMFRLIDKYRSMNGLWGVSLIKNSNDFNENGANLVLGLEAGANLIRAMEDLRRLVDLNVKIVGFQYNRDTLLATNQGGLTEFGVEALMFLFENNLMVDLAHASFKTRQDVLNIAGDMGVGNLVSYTHGSTEDDILDAWKNKMGERALKYHELKRLVEMGGIVGLGVSKPFFGNIYDIARRVCDVAQIDGGIDRIAIGTDFGGVPPYFLDEISSADDMYKLGDVLSEKFGVDDESIDKVLRCNVKSWLKDNLS